MVSGLSCLTYEVGLAIIEERRICRDMIECYKISNKKYDASPYTRLTMGREDRLAMGTCRLNVEFQ